MSLSWENWVCFQIILIIDETVFAFYPIIWLSVLQNRCVNMIAHLFHAPVGDDETAVGVGTVGSSEAIMLAGLAFKRKWQAKRKAQGKPYDKPNIVTGANVQVCQSVCSCLLPLANINYLLTLVCIWHCKWHWEFLKKFLSFVLYWFSVQSAVTSCKYCIKIMPMLEAWIDT